MIYEVKERMEEVDIKKEDGEKKVKTEVKDEKGDVKKEDVENKVKPK